MVFTTGELFDSYADLCQQLTDFSEENFCHFYIKDSKKLAPDEVVNPHLIYKHIVYCCIYGGQKPRFRGSGSRSVTSIRHGCTASLYLRVTKDRNHLQVRSFSGGHNHEVSEELFRAAAQDKKLPWDLKAEVEELLLLGADKDRLCEYIRHVSKKSLEKKNLFNMYETAIKQQREISRERAVMLIQKAYAVDTEEEADQILSQLLETTRPTRRSRKSEPEVVDNVQYAFVNEGGETQEEVEDETLQRLMGTLSGPDDRIVIVQGDEEFEVVEADQSMEEYLEDDIEKEGEVLIKQEMNKDEDAPNDSGPRYITLKDISRGYQNRKRPAPKIVNAKVNANHKFVQSANNVVYEPRVKTRVLAQYQDVEDSPEPDPLAEDIQTLKVTTLRAEQDKLIAETEMLKLKRNKVVRDIAKVDLEKSKLYLEIDHIKQSKKYLMDKTLWLKNDLENKQLKNEKLQLEIAKLKLELNENPT